MQIDFDVDAKSMYNLRFSRFLSLFFSALLLEVTLPVLALGENSDYLFDEVSHVRGHKNRWQTI
jgi:hypothetical protein